MGMLKKAEKKAKEPEKKGQATPPSRSPIPLQVAGVRRGPRRRSAAGFRSRPPRAARATPGRLYFPDGRKTHAT